MYFDKIIKEKTIKAIQPKRQSKIFEIRCSKRKEFDIKAINNFFKKKINLFKEKNFNDLKKPFVLKRIDFFK